MSKENYILMVFEGAKTEPQILENLKRYFLNESDKKIVKAVYGTVIYGLYKKFFPNNELDDELALFDLLKKEMKVPELKDIETEFVSEIYLFFDYDKHATNAGDEKLETMLQFFDNETENGKLYVSYPMIEAIQHLKENVNFQETIEECNKEYKDIVKQNRDKCFGNLSWLKEEHWDRIIQEHSKKANLIVNDDFSFPKEIIEQFEIFNHQKEKFIKPQNKVAVLASFPLFLLDYYGVKKFINDEEVIEE